MQICLFLMNFLFVQQFQRAVLKQKPENAIIGEEMDNIRMPESILLHELFVRRGYDKRIRPVANVNQTVNVTFVLDLFQILNVDGKSQTIALFCWLYEYWNDNRLVWQPSQYNGLDQLSLNHRDLWIPDTTLINNIEMDRDQVKTRQNVVIDLVNGNAQMFLPCTAQYTVGCRFDVQLFPFDEQRCTLQFASWAYDISKIDYLLPNGETTFEAYQENDEWDVVSFKLEKKLIRYICCPRQYAHILAHLVIRRKPLYYVVNLMLPTLIISLIASVGLFASSASPESKENKVSTGITTLLALSVLLLTVSDQIPKGSTSIPLLGYFYLMVMIHLSLETLLAVYLSYPDHEQRVASMLTRWKLMICRRKAVVRQKAQSQFHSPEINSNSTYVRRDYLDIVNPGKACMILNVLIIAIITLCVFVGGFLRWTAASVER